MEKYLGRRKLYVYKDNYDSPNGQTKTYIKGGVLNTPEELPGTNFWIKKTDDGFVMENYNNGGHVRTTRKSTRQVVITVGIIENDSALFKCYKTDTGYKYVKIEPIYGVGNGKNIVYLRKNSRGQNYICLSLDLLKPLNLKKNDILELTITLNEDYSIKIKKATEKSQKISTDQKIVTLIEYVGKNKTFYIPSKLFKYLQNTEALVAIEQNKSILLVKYPDM